MTEREFRGWLRFSGKHLLPSRRQELYLAQVAYVIAQTAGTTDMTLKDFILDFGGKAKKQTAEDSALMLANIAQGPGVRKLGQGRKKKVA